MRDISKELDLTQAALYYHFKNKDEIFFSILDRFAEMVFHAIREELDAPDDLVTVFHNAVKRHVVISRDYSKEVKLLIEDRKLLSAECVELVRVKERKIFELYRRHFERLQSAGLVSSMSPIVMTFTLLAAANSVYQWYDRSGSLTADDIAEQLASLFVAAKA